MPTIGQKIIDRKLQDFAGARIAGQLVLSDELVNELLLLGLQEAKSSTDKNEGATSTDSGGNSADQSLDLSFILRQLSIDKLQYRSEAATTILDISAQLGAPKEQG